MILADWQICGAKRRQKQMKMGSIPKEQLNPSRRPQVAHAGHTHTHQFWAYSFGIQLLLRLLLANSIHIPKRNAVALLAPQVLMPEVVAARHGRVHAKDLRISSYQSTPCLWVFVCLHVWLSVWLSVCLSVRLLACLLVCLYVWKRKQQVEARQTCWRVPNVRKHPHLCKRDITFHFVYFPLCSKQNRSFAFQKRMNVPRLGFRLLDLLHTSGILQKRSKCGIL